jgi:hypothetical protein
MRVRAVQTPVQTSSLRKPWFAGVFVPSCLQPDDRVRVDYDDVQLTFDVDKGAAEVMEEVEEPESLPAHV